MSHMLYSYTKVSLQPTRLASIIKGRAEFLALELTNVLRLRVHHLALRLVLANLVQSLFAHK